MTDGVPLHLFREVLVGEDVLYIGERRVETITTIQKSGRQFHS